MNPVLHPRQATALDRTCPGQLTILTEEFLLDGTAPRYGYINGSPGVMTLGQFTVNCRKRPGGKSLNFSRLDLNTVNLEHPKRYENGRFQREGLMAFDYVYYRSARAAAGERLPVVFYSVGSGNKNNAAGNKQILNYAAALMTSEAFQAVYPCHVIAPWFPMPAHPPQGPEGNAQLEAYAKSTATLTRSLAEAWNADLSRIYFIGTGGGALYQHLAADPTFYAAAAMLTSVFDYFADGSEIAYLKALTRLPIYISHAASDFPCPVRRSRIAYARLLEFGNRDVYYREYTDDKLKKQGIDVTNQAGSHESPRIDLADPGLYRWLFYHRQKQA
jgi:predicted peptidase